jgi:hypothetical protein
MKYLNNFEEYSRSESLSKDYNESKFTKYVAGAAIAGATLWGADAIMNPNTKVSAEYQETELAHFPEFYVRTLGADDNIQVTVNDVDGVIGCKTSQGKHNGYTITVEEGQDIIYYKVSTWGEYIYGTTNKSILPNGNMINLSELEVVEETSNYKILSVPSFWSGLDLIFVNKGYSNPKDEFEMNGQKYTYLEKSFGFVQGNESFVIKCKD